MSMANAMRVMSAARNDRRELTRVIVRWVLKLKHRARKVIAVAINARYQY